MNHFNIFFFVTYLACINTILTLYIDTLHYSPLINCYSNFRPLPVIFEGGLGLDFHGMMVDLLIIYLFKIDKLHKKFHLLIMNLKKISKIRNKNVSIFFF